MLLEFRCSNFKSFKEEVVFSMVASKDPALLGDNTIETGLVKTPYALKSAAIYGANASGKSNLLKAIQFMHKFVIDSFQQKPETKFKIYPFKLQENAQNIPSYFEMTFLIENKKYQYSFGVTSERVTSEQLLVFETQRPKTIFTREYDITLLKDVFYFPESTTKKDKIDWSENTHEYILFISTVFQYKKATEFLPIRDFFNKIALLLESEKLHFDYSTSLLKEEKNNNLLVEIMSIADFGISTIVAEEVEATKIFIKNDENNKPEMKHEISTDLIPKFLHKTQNHEMELMLFDESNGTQIMFSLVGPLIEVFEKGRIFIIDELDKSLHPFLVRKIVELFHNTKINTKGAQLIFTTHDVTLLNNDYAIEKPLFRRDQIWFTDKNQTQETKLTPLLDFSSRNTDPFEKWYLQGRYGGVPFLPNSLIAPKDLPHGQ